MKKWPTNITNLMVSNMMTLLLKFKNLIKIWKGKKYVWKRKHFY